MYMKWKMDREVQNYLKRGEMVWYLSIDSLLHAHQELWIKVFLKDFIVLISFILLFFFLELSFYVLSFSLLPKISLFFNF